ncbi:MAG: hypothetical protein D4R80_07430 [Deltaproteobacteria bacterium]|nr:MAG: hypothetical protein D4R80_07430 [Deltaproteobacteria bacterium]
MKRVLILFLSASFLAGCSSGFVYQRKADPAQDGQKGSIKVAVVAFEDGTRNFTSEGNIISGHLFNLARTDINSLSLSPVPVFSVSPLFTVSSLPAANWSKSLAEDMAASGAFRSVKFVFGPSEVTDEEIVVEGALTKAYLTTISDKPDEFVLHLKVRRVSDNTIVLEGDVGKTGVRPSGLTTTCFTYGGCVVGRINKYLNGIMQGIFADVQRDLVLALAPPPVEKNPVPHGQESPEEVVKRILGKE